MHLKKLSTSLLLFKKYTNLQKHKMVFQNISIYLISCRILNKIGQIPNLNVLNYVIIESHRLFLKVKCNLVRVQAVL